MFTFSTGENEFSPFSFTPHGNLCVHISLYHQTCVFGDLLSQICRVHGADFSTRPNGAVEYISTWSINSSVQLLLRTLACSAKVMVLYHGTDKKNKYIGKNGT
jgi:hypothetical protein